MLVEEEGLHFLQNYAVHVKVEAVQGLKEGGREGGGEGGRVGVRTNE